MDCKELNKLKGTLIDVDWHQKSTYYDTELIVNANDRLGLLKDILDVISKNNVHVRSANARLVSGNNVICTFGLKIKDLNAFEEIMKKTKLVKGVTNVYRE
ncbi:bifunctional (p)ppGpp synthetase/guanosine-3',5'-bis(diphosphate) 3'-pyrophosphohydrolase [archaeon]|nr:bifunctional (p)ppGpp synthetase/guanosine-3',5'-bis(diphosphate) 3'-pyrophosphohydrolase [archaeon]